MIRIAIIILVLLIGCAMPPEPEPQFVEQYLSLHGETFKTDYPNLKGVRQEVITATMSNTSCSHVRQNLNGSL